MDKNIHMKVTWKSKTAQDFSQFSSGDRSEKVATFSSPFIFSQVLTALTETALRSVCLSVVDEVKPVKKEQL